MSGEGVFVTINKQVVHCGRVRNGAFIDGRMIIGNYLTGELLSVDTLTLPNKTKQMKVESSNQNDHKRGFYINGNKVAETIPRFNLKRVDKTWLGLDARSCEVWQNKQIQTLGEHVNNKLHGRGIKFQNKVYVTIGYWFDDENAPGCYMNIYRWGDFHVGEFYMQGGRLRSRGTRYDTDGSSERFGY